MTTCIIWQVYYLSFSSNVEKTKIKIPWESSRKQVSDSIDTWKCKGRDMWELGWDRGCTGRSYLAAVTEGLIDSSAVVLPPQWLQWMCTGTAGGIASLSVVKAKLNESTQIRSELPWTSLASLLLLVFLSCTSVLISVAWKWQNLSFQSQCCKKSFRFLHNQEEPEIPPKYRNLLLRDL